MSDTGTGISQAVRRLRSRLAWWIHPNSGSVKVWLGELRFELQSVADNWAEEDKQSPADEYPLHDPYLASTLAKKYENLGEALSSGAFEDWSEVPWDYGPDLHDDD